MTWWVEKGYVAFPKAPPAADVEPAGEAGPQDGDPQGSEPDA